MAAALRASTHTPIPPAKTSPLPYFGLCRLEAGPGAELKANLLALETDRADYQAVNVGTGVATSVNDIAQLLAQGPGKEIHAEVVGQIPRG